MISLSNKVLNSIIVNNPQIKKLEVVLKVTIPISNFLLSQMILWPLCKVLGKFKTLTLKIWLESLVKSLETLPKSRSLRASKTKNRLISKKFNEIPRATKSPSRNKKLSLKLKILTSSSLMNPTNSKRRSTSTVLRMKITTCSKTKKDSLRTKFKRLKISRRLKIKMPNQFGSNSIKKFLVSLAPLRREPR